MATRLPVAPLSGVSIVEAIDPRAPRALRLASGMCGRIALDLGADVYLLSAADLADDEPETEIFLNSGKTRIDADPENFLEGIDKAFDCFITDVGSHAALVDKSGCTSSIVLAMSIDDPLGGSEFTLEARSGLLDLVGDPDRQPLRLGGHQVSYAAGLACYLCVVDIVINLRAGIAPEVRRLDLLDVGVWLNWKAVGAASLGLPVPTRQGDGGPWLVAPCRDGFVAVVYRSVDWDTLVSILGDERLEDPGFATESLREANRSELNAVLKDSFSDLTRADIREISLRHRLPLGPVQSLGELTQDSHMMMRDFFYPVKTADGDRLAPSLPVKWNNKTVVPKYFPSTGGVRNTSSVSGASRNLEKQSRKVRCEPFSECRVLDLGIITAGAGTSAVLADLGADVIKIEGPKYQDPFRKWDGVVPDDTVPGVPPYFRMTNRGKRNLVLDLKSPRARDRFLEMVKTSDVVVENFRRGVLEDLGLEFEVLKSVNPKIILASISSQGESGPDANYVSFGTTLEAMAGLASVTGYTGGDPVVTGRELNYPDQVVAVFAASMIKTAWLAVQQGGDGVHLDLSQRELTTFLCGEAVLGNPERRGNAQPGIRIQDCFLSADGMWVAVTAREPDLAKLRANGCGEGRAEFERWVAQRHSDEVTSVLENLEIPVARVLTGDGVVKQRSSSWKRGLILDQYGFLVKGLLFDSGKRPEAIDRPASPAGALSREILGEFTGLTGKALDDVLLEVGAKVEDPDPVI